MNRLRILGGALLFALIGTGFAYVIATGFLSFRYGLNGQYLDWDHPAATVADFRTAVLSTVAWLWKSRLLRA